MLLLRRLMGTVPVLVVVAVIVFLVLHLTPGDPAAAIVGQSGTSADIARVHAELGLDRPLPLQFTSWAGRVLRGDLGHSYYMNETVTGLISQRVGPTLSLALLTIIMTVVIAVPMGVAAAWKRDGLLDRALMSMSVLGFSVPAFVIGYVLIWAIGVKLEWLPVQGYATLHDGLWPWFQHLILPSVTLSIVYVALIARVTRASVAEALTEDHIRTARAKGLSEARIVLRHALANAAVPIVTVIGIGIALLIGGVVVTETVFAIPGLGQLTVDAVVSRDYPLVQGLTLFFSVVYVVVNLAIDLSYLLFDPRIRY